MKRHAAPIVDAILLLLPVLYVGSYFALVMPGGRMVLIAAGKPVPVVDGLNQPREISHYRFGHETPRQIYWPLEQIDRKVRPGAWEPLLRLGTRSFRTIYDPAIQQ
jgi:hypothetical protein